MHRHQAKGETRYGQADPALCQAAFRATVPVSSRRHGRRHGRNPLIYRQLIQQTPKSFSTMAGFIPILLAVSLNKSRRSTADPVAILST
jgi:hypothetical protein